MGDIADRAQNECDAFLDAALKNSTKPIEPGVWGECDYCGEVTMRIVRGACCRCRDLRKLP